ncbi:MAG: hypothetical protein IJ747_09475, partial [Lachnospiraceae bacterium]|nr:hypothetical protein [Lachnospiraceae bacterium]
VKSAAEVKQSAVKVTLAKGIAKTYNGQAQTLTVTEADSEGKITTQGELTVTDAAGKVLAEGSDFAVSYSANVNAGTVKVTVAGIGAYSGNVVKSFKIQPAKAAPVHAVLLDADGEVLAADQAVFTYVKSGVTPKLLLTATLPDSEHADQTIEQVLTEGVDYKVSYQNNKKVTSAKKAGCKVTFLGNYKGAKVTGGYTEFAITPASLADAEVVAADLSYAAKNNKAAKYLQLPFVTVSGTLLAKSEYTVTYTYADGEKAGSAVNKTDVLSLSAEQPEVTIRAEINAKGVNYTDGETKPYATYTVRYTESAKTDISKAKITLADASGAKVKQVSYTGKAITFTPGEEGNQAELVLTVGSGKNAQTIKGEELSTHFDITYANNVAKGKGTVVISAKAGDDTYVGARSATFTIAAENVKSAMKLKDTLTELLGRIFGE